MTLILFIVGPPASGKTTLALSLLSRVDTLSLVWPKWTVSQKLCALGHYSPDIKHQGADTVPPHQGEAHLIYHSENLSHLPLTIIDGNRCASAQYPAFFAMSGSRVACAHIDAPEDVLTQRRFERGTKTNPGWMVGRRKMARMFADGFKNKCRLELDGTQPEHLNAAHTIKFIMEQGCEVFS